MKLFFGAYGLTLLAFAVVDVVWLSLMTSRLYRPEMGGLLATSFKLLPAIGFYALYSLGVTLLVVIPALKGQLYLYGLPYFWGVTFHALLLGLVAYGTYNLTGLAVIQGWPTKLTFIDLAWGGVLTTLTTHGAIYLARLLKLAS